MADEISFPVTHDKCPVCGSTKRLGQQVVDGLKKAGGLPQAFPYVGINLHFPLLDPVHPPSILATNFTVKTLVVAFDVCAEVTCGAVYCTNFNVMEQPAQLVRQPQPGGQTGLGQNRVAPRRN